MVQTWIHEVWIVNPWIWNCELVNSWSWNRDEINILNRCRHNYIVSLNTRWYDVAVLIRIRSHVPHLVQCQSLSVCMRHWLLFTIFVNQELDYVFCRPIPRVFADKHIASIYEAKHFTFFLISGTQKIVFNFRDRRLADVIDWSHCWGWNPDKNGNGQ